MSKIQSSSRQNHELLHGKAVSSVLSAIDDIERRGWQDILSGIF
jgi:hypothetical protein